MLGRQMIVQTDAGNVSQSVASSPLAKDRMTLRRLASALTTCHAGPLLVAMLMFSCFYGWSVWRYGSMANGIAVVDGAALIADEPVLELGEIPVGTACKGVFTLTNVTHDPITIVGGMTDCSCAVLGDMPVEVEPMSSIPFSFELSAKPGDLNQHVVRRALLHLNTDSPQLTLTLVADVVADGRAQE